MSVAIVCMVNQTAIKRLTGPQFSLIDSNFTRTVEDTCLFKQLPGAKSLVRID